MILLGIDYHIKNIHKSPLISEKKVSRKIISKMESVRQYSIKKIAAAIWAIKK